MKLPRWTSASTTRKGVVATTCISVVSVVSVLVVALLGRRSMVSHDVVLEEHALVAEGIAESAVHLAAARLWSDYRMLEKEGVPDSLGFGVYLDGRGIVQAPSGFDFLPELGVHQDREGAFPLGGGFVMGIEVLRRETPRGIELVLTATANMGDGTPEQRASRLYDSAGQSKEE